MKELLTPLVEQALVKLDLPNQTVSVTPSTNRGFGDYATNIALQLAKNQGKNPMDIAQEVIENLPENNLVKKAEAVAPGFINFTVKDSELINYFIQERQLEPDFGKGKTVVTDTSHPNIAKPMGIHHILSTIIGGSINNLLKYSGFTVIRDNFLGDVGTQFGKLIYAYKTWGNKAEIEKNPIPELLKLYVEFHTKAEQDPSLEDYGRAEFKKLEDGDPENRALWQWMKDLSLVEFMKTYKRLHVEFDLMNGESFYEDKMDAILELGKKTGVFTEGEKGALVCNFPEELKLPTCVIQKSDGATIYHTRDLARKKYIEDTYHAHVVIVVVDMAQELYFKQLFAMLRMLNLSTAELVHVSFGRMQFKDRKMSTRKGNILYLEQVLDEAIKATQELLKEKEVDFPEEELKQLTETIAIGAVKYGILSQNRSTNIVFDWDKIISLDGNSGPYLQYTYARGKSILKKAAQEASLPNDSNVVVAENHSSQPDTLEPEEKELILHLIAFTDAVKDATIQYKPNLLANYLYELAQIFNSFYNKVPVIKATEPIRNFRLKLIQRSCTILQVGLTILGIDVPERM